MAIYHLRVKFVQRSKGRSAVSASAYRSGTRQVDERTGGTIHDYTRKRDIEHSVVLLPDNAPSHLSDRGTLWNTIETRLTHPRAQPAFEVEVALPRELGRDECRQLVHEFAQAEFVDKGLPVDLNIHRTVASDGGEHPHCHMLIGTRRFNENGSIGKAARDLQDNPKLIEKIYALEKNKKFDEALLLQDGTNLGHWRQSWEDYSNRFLHEGGSDARIDHRTLAAQAIERDLRREPTPNIGIAFYGRLRGFTQHMAERVQHWRDVGWRNAVREQFDRIREQKPDLTAEYIAHVRAYAPNLHPELAQEGPQPQQEIDHER